MTEKQAKVLLIGYGNPGRLDDGLGPVLAEAVEKENLPGVTVDSDYQLNVEDAAAIAENDIVIFADASMNCKGPFSFYAIEPKLDVSFSSHSVDAQAILGLAYELFNAKTKGYVLAIRGYKFDEFGQEISQQAQENLEKAVEFVKKAVTKGSFTETQ